MRRSTPQCWHLCRHGVKTAESPPIAGQSGYSSHFDVPGVAFTASSGDSDTATHYPAASPYVTAVGGDVADAGRGGRLGLGDGLGRHRRRLQADLTAIASGELDPAVRRELESMADRESSGGAAVYRFSPASVRRAFDEGRDSASLLAFLTGHAARGVPQPLEYLIGDLGRRFGQLRLRGVGCYLRSDDTALLTELTRARALAPLGLSLIAPTVLAVEADATTAMAALRAQGYLPAAEGPDGQPLVVRPVAPRAPASGRGVGPLTVDQDWVGLVAQLRAGEPELSGPQLSLAPDDEPARPTLRSGDPGTMRGLLALAIEQEWAGRRDRPRRGVHRAALGRRRRRPAL